MDLQERLQAVQAEHQDITQQIAEADAHIAEAQQAYEEAQGHFLHGRANAQLQVRFLEGQMAAYSAMMQEQALTHTQESLPNDVDMRPGVDEIGDWRDAAGFEHLNDPAVDPASPPVKTREGLIRLPREKSLPMLNGTQENSQPN